MGATQKTDFIAFLRNSDGKYCYANYSLRTTKNRREDDETLEVNKIEINVDKIPGLHP